jgi:hypothetical protein
LSNETGGPDGDTCVTGLKKDGLLVVQTRGRGNEFPWHQFKDSSSIPDAE